MSSVQKSLTFTTIIKRNVNDVFTAFTTAGDFCDWLCYDAQVEAVVDGRIYLYWEQGFYVSGHFTQVKANESLRFVWYGKGEPAATEVEVQIVAVAEGTEVTVHHHGIGASEAWQKIEKELTIGWEFGLANLKSILETGIDKRVFDKPVLGIVPGDVITAAEASVLGLPVAGGVLINGTVPGSGAEDAGLQPNDLIYKIEGNRIQTFADLGPAIANYRVDETVRVLLVRGGETQKVMMRLSSRPLPQVPATPHRFQEILEALNMEMAAELMDILDGVTNEVADKVIAPDSWSLKQILAHLVGTERVVQVGIALRMSADGPANFIRFPDNMPAWIDSIVDSHATLVRLVGMWQGAKRETAILVGNLPDALVTRKADYLGLGGLLLQALPRHTANHFEEMRLILTQMDEMGE